MEQKNSQEKLDNQNDLDFEQCPYFKNVQDETFDNEFNFRHKHYHNYYGPNWWEYSYNAYPYYPYPYSTYPNGPLFRTEDIDSDDTFDAESDNRHKHHHHDDFCEPKCCGTPYPYTCPSMPTCPSMTISGNNNINQNINMDLDFAGEREYRHSHSHHHECSRPKHLEYEYYPYYPCYPYPNAPYNAYPYSNASCCGNKNVNKGL